MSLPLIAPNIPWNSSRSQLVDLINAKAAAAKTGHPLLEQFVNVNLEALIATLPNNWTPTNSDDPA